MGSQEGDDLLVRERLGDAALAADDPLGAPQRVEDGLLGGVDRRREEGVERAIGHRVRAPGGREGDEDLAAAVVRDGARAREPEAGAQSFCGWKSSGSTGKGGLGPYYLAQFMREQSRTVVGEATQ